MQPDAIDLHALASALRAYVARGCGHWRVDKLLEAVEREQKEARDG